MYSKYAFLIPLKDKKGISIINAFNKIIKQSYNEGKSVVAERFIRALKNKLYKHMAATGKNVYYDVLDDVVNKYNNTKHSTIKMKPLDVKDTTKSSSLERNHKNKRVYIDEHNEKDSRL